MQSTHSYVLEGGGGDLFNNSVVTCTDCLSPFTYIYRDTRETLCTSLDMFMNSMAGGYFLPWQLLTAVLMQ